MSSILKALNKVEGEQNGYKPKTLPPENRVPNGSLLKFFSYALLFTAASVLIYYLVAKPSKQTELKKLENKIKSDQITVVPTPTDTTMKTQSVGRNDLNILPKQHKKPGSGTPAQTISVKPKNQMASKSAVDKTRNTNKEKINLQSETISFEIPPKQLSSPKTKPILEVNGIAYQGENGDSIAVVNGVSLSKNSVIQGVTVEEIRENKVVFRQNGKTFDVELGKSSEN